MKSLKYWLSFLSIIVLIAIPCGIFYYTSTNDIDIIQIMSQHLAISAVCVVVWFLLFQYVNVLYEKAKYNKNENAFGMTTDFDYMKLSDKERKEYDKQRKEEMNRVLSDSTIRKATHPGSKNPDKEMEALSGMEDVKEKIIEIIARANYDKKISKKGESFNSHYVFYGAPGTGKTTFARILTGYLYKNRIISKNQCIEVDGNLLKASAPGEGGMKAEILVKNALGGVLFIDEAYSMAEGYGNEAVDTLIKLMEDMRGQFVLILAGYTKPMANLLSANPGFRSRIKDYIEFKDYTVDEAVSIFKSMAKEYGLKVSKGGIRKFTERYQNEMKKPDFGNARTIRNILDESISKHAVNLIKDTSLKQNILTENDINLESKKTI